MAAFALLHQPQLAELAGNILENLFQLIAAGGMTIRLATN
ncbi:hypothetical protein LHK_02178 [Laribacter hongkongensis HLHK9]|uniref:Uncharacterized protein n=1 Tax=Laribacter hongkongensis (strain HLHK9) TaxID=557598 RepID=C1D9R0_LARHH|nr:hypothetical protein LHK_02178 [Laribacter hongkongensis HLHK9]